MLLWINGRFGGGKTQTAHELHRRLAGSVIAPMTIVEPEYLHETVGRLRERGHDVRQIALLAERRPDAHARMPIAHYADASAAPGRERSSSDSTERCRAQTPH